MLVGDRRGTIALLALCSVLAGVAEAAFLAVLVSIALALGLALGPLSGYYGGRIDSVIMRVADVFFAFPYILFVLLLVVVLGPGFRNVFIAIGLLSEPSVLLLDEPSASLDPRQRERLWEFISALADRGTTVVFSTHNVAEVERYASRVLLLADGELLFTGTPSELEAAVGGDPRDFEHALVNFLHQHGH